MATINEITRAKIADLTPYENNARVHTSDQVDQIAASIKEFGFLNPVLIDKAGHIIAGHGRVMAAERLGMEEVPAIYVEGLTDDQRRAYILADNRLTELGGWDDAVLAGELKDLTAAGFDITLTGFDWDSASALDPIEESFGDAREILDPIEEKPEEARTKRGDIWALGDHRLVCGDASDPADMARLFNGEQADLVFTDPPYGVAVGSKNASINAVDPGRGGRISEDIENDTISPEDLRGLLTRAFVNLRENCTPACSYYITSPQGGELFGVMLDMMKDAGLPVRHILIWVKSSAVFSMGRLDYDYRHEPILYTWTQKHNFRGGYDNSIIDDNQRLEELSKAELKELVHALKGDGKTTAIYCDKPAVSKLHPTMKPLNLIQRFIYNNSTEGDRVADIFGGSGSTLIVCEKMKRRCFMMEIDPHYCDVIIERWEQFTGQTAQRIGG